MLETQGLSKARQWEILQDVLISLDGFAKAKLESSLLKNPDIIYVSESLIYMNDGDLEFNIRTKFAPLVSVDAERTFSIYKAMLVSNRENFTFANIKMIMILKENSFLFCNAVNL